MIANGGFETGDFTGWTPGYAADGSLLTTLMAFDTLTPNSGDYFAAYSALGPESDSLSQTVNTVAGNQYLLTYYLATNDTLGDNFFEVDWNGNALTGSEGALVENLNNLGYASYKKYTFDVTATGSQSTVMFSGYNTPGTTALDDISLNPVPEPTTMAALALGSVALIRRRRRA